MATKKAAPKKAAKKAAPKKAAAKSAAIKIGAVDKAKILACLNKSGKATIAIKEVASTKLPKGGASTFVIYD